MEQHYHLFKCLESYDSKIVDDAKNRFREQFNSNKESWLVNGLVEYFFSSNSLRAVDVLVAIREPHDKYLFDRLAESLKSSQKLSGLTLLGHVAQRQPTWLYKIVHHPMLMKDLLKILKKECDMLEVISALLVLNVLLPIIPGLIGSHLNEIFDVFSRLAAWNCDNYSPASTHLLHLQVALYALFYQLYGMFPCTFLSYLKQEYNKYNDNSCNVFNHTVKPMIETVRLHPFLIMSSPEEETCADRWKKSEHHDVVFNCTRFLLDACDRPCRDDVVGSLKSHPSLEASTSSDVNRSYNEQLSPNICTKSYCLHCGSSTPKFSLVTQLDSEIMSGNTTPAPLGVESTPTSIPYTPFKTYTSSSFNQQEGTSPPEPAIEATPETTPVKDVRQVSRISSTLQSPAVRALNTFSPNDPFTKPNDTPPTSPMKKDVFNFPSSNPSPPAKSVTKVIDDRIVALENSQSKRKLSTLPSPLTIATNQLDQMFPEERETDAQNNDLTSRENNVGSRSDLNNDIYFDEDCSQDSGSPCPKGGLHFPRYIRTRPRYQTESNIPQSQSLGLGIGSSPQLLTESKVRRTQSWPRILNDGDQNRKQNKGKSNRVKSHLSEERSTQTDIVPPGNPPYEHLFLGVFPASFSYHSLNQYSSPPLATPSLLTSSDTSTYLSGHSIDPCCVRKPNEPVVSFKPYGTIDTLIDNVFTQHRAKLNLEYELRVFKEQLFLMNLQVHFERHRREVHSERNRRLLGKCRNNRALEEHNSALRDQVELLQKDIEKCVEDMTTSQTDCRNKVEKLEENIKYLKQENLELQKTNLNLKSKCQTLEQEIRSETEKNCLINQILHETKAKLFDSNNEKDHYKQAILENKKLSNELNYFQKEIIILGEMNSKYKDILSYLSELKAEYQYTDLFNKAYIHQIDQLHKLYENQSIYLESVKNQINQLEAMVSDKDKTIANFKYLFNTVKNQHQEQLETMTSRYNSIEISMNRQRTEELELRYQLDVCRKKLGRYQQKYPSFEKAITNTLGPIPPAASAASSTLTQQNNMHAVKSLSSFVVNEMEKSNQQLDRSDNSLDHD